MATVRQTRRARRDVDSGVTGEAAADLYVVWTEILDQAEVPYQERQSGLWGVDRKIHISFHPEDERKGLNLLAVARWFLQETSLRGTDGGTRSSDGGGGDHVKRANLVDGGRREPS